ncbi:MAG: UDP-glucose 4-epimerase GalE [Clostridia bacterium]|nr:UDP-glucose 4-epimerase GalE [Clostridia bacterium]MBQ7788168.1 UDP-glucose 4-epimerase GalE [Clostridia bacterium]
MAILVTGGTGYIGSHTVVQLLNDNREVVILDNLSNSKLCVLDRIKEITGKSVKFYKGDILNIDDIEKVFKENEIDAVIHFAGLKAVGESVAKPMYYYHNNVTGTLNLCNIMSKYNCKKIVFSSSATVYGKPKSVPISEDFPLSTTNPYGETKLMIERILSDIYVSDNDWSVCILRYFNPIGAHESGLMGEDPKGIPNNLLPYVARVAFGKYDHVNVFGNDYATHDGTGVRDYIHVVDLADAHLKAIDFAMANTGIDYFNIGTGIGYSVLDIIHAYEKAVGHPIKYEICQRRPGDIDECYANPEKALKVLGWKANFDIEKMCYDSANWQSKNPDGYGE